MKTKQFLLASVVCFAPFTAAAADLPVKAPPPVAPLPFSWTGFYVGASGGIISQGTTATTDIFGITGGVVASNSLGITGFGFIGGGNVGYNYQFGGNWVLGIEADISGTSLNDDADPFFGALIYSSRLNALATVRGRLGYAFDRALLYGTGGLAIGHVKNSVNSPFFCGKGAVCSWSSDKWKTGWTAGGGLEYAITRNWTVRAEALYVNLGKTEINAPDLGTSGCRFGFKNRYVIGRLGVNYKF
jgi:outer membrane immunogenic protein